MQWILDLDDTLILGPNTWAFEEVLPDLIRSHGLPYDKALFDAVTLKAQQQANEDVSEEDILNFVFDTLKWPSALKRELIDRVYNGYQPYLFDDVKPFLAHIHGRGDTLYMISNNNHAHDLVQAFGIADYFTDILTPKHSASRAKPNSEMWDKLAQKHALNGQSVMVGDDPWSDGTFSGHAGIPCWIIDRLGRYDALHDTLPYRWAKTLDDVRHDVR